MISFITMIKMVGLTAFTAKYSVEIKKETEEY